jgi:hypothetical protein
VTTLSHFPISFLVFWLSLSLSLSDSAERARFTAVEQLIASSDARHANTERSLLETQIALATVERAMAECSQRYARGAEAVRVAGTCRFH